MAQIGVVTFSQTLDNYGQVLQYLAIQEYLSLRGHQVYLIRIDSSVGLVRKIYRKLKSLVKKKEEKTYSTFDKWAEMTLANEKLHPRGFEAFRKEFCKIVNLQVPMSRKIFDAVVIGSDQIWSYVSPFNFLDFAKHGEDKFAIAPSIGKFRFDDASISIVKGWLKDFKFITCREQSAVDMCKRAGREDAMLVLDPTFLISSETYLKYASSQSVKENYVFVYLLGADISVDVAQIYDFAKKENLQVKYVASQGRDDAFPKEWATIPEWISLLANAKYVFTNSFHGMALSCIFHKQFLVFPIVGEMVGMNERIYSIARTFSCESHIYSEHLEKVKEPIDYDVIDTRIASNRNLINDLLDSIKY